MSARRWAWALASLILVFGLAIWGMKRGISFSFVPKLSRVVRIGVPFGVNSGLVLIADEMGFFEKEGVKVEIQRFPTGKKALESMMDGESDYAIAFETAITLSILRGQTPVILSEVYTASGNTSILHPKSFKLKQPRDFHRARVGLPLGTSAEFALRLYLTTIGVGWNELKIFDLAPEVLERHLKEGTVDAIVAWEPNVSKIYEENLSSLRKIETSAFAEISSLLSRREELKDHPESATAVLRALWRAVSYYRVHRTEAQRLIERKTDIARSPSIEAMWERTSYQLGLSSVLVTMLKEEMNWFANQRGLGPASGHQLEDFIDPSFLESVSPELVTYR